MFTNEEIATYYDRCEVHYRQHWNLDQSLSLHYGYWDEQTSSFHEALVNINHVLANWGGIVPNSQVLDAGCGIGGSSLFLASNYQCQVTGISLSAKQVATATDLATSRQLSHLAHFQQSDFTQTPFADNSFDCVWAIESVCHAPRKVDFLREAFRVLKPGGRLVMADFFQQPSQLNEEEQTLMNQWAYGWAVPSFERLDRFVETMCELGFGQVDTRNATQNIMPSARRLYIRFFPGWVIAKLYQLLFRASDIGIKNVWTAYYQYVTLKKELWGYYLVQGVKEMREG